jgi:hypothetical protein
MNDENNITAPVLDDIDYSEPAPKKDNFSDVAAPVLDDMDAYIPQASAKKGAPTGVSAPTLDDENYYYSEPSSEKKGAPTGVSAPILDDDNYTAPDAAYSEPAKLILSDEEIISGMSPEQQAMFNELPEEKRQQVLAMRRQQLGAEAPAPAVSAPVLDEDNYVPPPKKEKASEPETPISAPILDDEPEPPKYVPKFVDEDLENAKKEAAKKAVSSQLVSDQKDSKESLRMMLELKAERRRELAAKGFKTTILVAILGIIGAVAFFLLYSGSLGLEYKDGLSGMANLLKNSAVYLSLAMAVSSITLVSGIGAFKSIASLIYVLSAIAQIFPGFLMISQHEGSFGLAFALYAVSLIGTIAVVVGLSAIESVGLYFKRNKL